MSSRRWLRLSLPASLAPATRKNHKNLRGSKEAQRARMGAALPAFVFTDRYQHGFAAFADYIAGRAGQAPPGWSGAAWFILCVAEECANLHLNDAWRPWRFLKQAASTPPLCFGPRGFAPHLVDDLLPARHYVALLFVGFWLPPGLAWVTLYTWEVAGFLRYGFQWSAPDVRLGRLGLRHGAFIRRYGPTVLPALLAAEVAGQETGD